MKEFFDTLIYWRRLLFYKMVFLEDKRELENESNRNGPGYYLLKRQWAWILFSPIILPKMMLLGMLHQIPAFFSSLRKFSGIWLDSDTDKKLTPKQYRFYFTRLYE